MDEGAPEDDLEITLTSSDPARLLISSGPGKPGSSSVKIKARQGYRESQEFWLQGLDSSGTVSYLAEAPGYSKATGTVTLAPAGVVIIGPLRGKKFIETTGGEPTKLRVFSVRIDSPTKYQEQAVAGGFSWSVDVKSSIPSLGSTADPTVVISGGQSNVMTYFKPTGLEGDTTLSLKPPAEVGLIIDYDRVIASVRKPGLALSDQVTIGQNLEIGGVLSLGQEPGGDGVNVTITSDDPSQLLLSALPTDPGTKSITINVPFGATFERYYIQALGSSGTVSYTATAPGFRKRTAIVNLAPSGVIITPYWQGPPDEAHVLNAVAPDSKSRFSVELSSKKSMELVVWTAQLDPHTHRSADITVQPLRGGQSLDISLLNSNPAIGEITQKVTIPGGVDHVIAPFEAKTIGSTEISVATPQGFTMSGNSTAAVGFVHK